MQIDKITTFCPAKWQEVVINAGLKYVYACCNSTATIFEKSNDIQSILKMQQDNLIAGIQDPSCDYCWKNENHRKKSLRHEKIENWNRLLDIQSLELNVGNVCNQQCVYCSPKFSSKWQKEMLNNSDAFRTILDNEHYKPINVSKQDYNLNDLIHYYNQFKPNKKITFIGGEPFLNNAVSEFIEKIDLTSIETHFSTNLCVDWKILSSILKHKNLNKIHIGTSLDSVNENVSKFIRYGFDPNLFFNNIYNILETTDATIEFFSLATAHTAFGLLDVFEFLDNLGQTFKNRISWCITNIKSPVNQSFKILQADEKFQIIDNLKKINILTNNIKIKGLDTIIGALEISEYSSVLRRDQANFFINFAKIKKIEIPKELEFIILK